MAYLIRSPDVRDTTLVELIMPIGLAFIQTEHGNGNDKNIQSYQKESQDFGVKLVFFM